MIQNAENLTAVVVDDDATARFLMTAVLKRLNCRVVEAKIGVEGLQQVRDVRPDLLVLDILMPHMDGLDTLRYLRSDPDFETLPVIVVSVLGEDHAIVRQLKALGILEYFTKPLDNGYLSDRFVSLFKDFSKKADRVGA